MTASSTLPTQIVTPELRDWIVAQSAAAMPRDRPRGDEGERLGGIGRPRRARRHARREGAGTAVAAPARPLPGRAIDATRPRVPAGDRDVAVLVAMSHPRVVVFGDLLSAEECTELIDLARKRLSRSETVATRTGASEVNEARTSDGMFFLPGEFPVCARLEARLAKLLDWPLENGEGLQILRYRPGAEYKPHYDYFDPAEPGTPAILKRGGQRLASIVCYLNTPERAGRRSFPKPGSRSRRSAATPSSSATTGRIPPPAPCTAAPRSLRAKSGSRPSGCAKAGSNSGSFPVREITLSTCQPRAGGLRCHA
jgi:prolyl 4-hydroxylase